MDRFSVPLVLGKNTDSKILVDIGTSTFAVQ